MILNASYVCLHAFSLRRESPVPDPRRRTPHFWGGFVTHTLITRVSHLRKRETHIVDAHLWLGARALKFQAPRALSQYLAKFPNRQALTLLSPPLRPSQPKHHHHCLPSLTMALECVAAMTPPLEHAVVLNLASGPLLNPGFPVYLTSPPPHACPMLATPSSTSAFWLPWLYHHHPHSALDAAVCLPTATACPSQSVQKVSNTRCICASQSMQCNADWLMLVKMLVMFVKMQCYAPWPIWI
jgi:hypothetical protein